VEEAVAAYRQAIDLDPGNAKAHYNLGNALKARGNGDEAIAAYRQAIELDPRNARAHYNLGLAVKARGQLDEAIEHYQLAIRLDGMLAGAHTNLGNALKGKGQLDEAIRAYHKAIDLDPRDARAHYNLGLALYGQGQAEEAMQHYRLAIHLDPQFALAHGAVGQALLKQGQFVQAWDATRRCLDLLPASHPLCKLVTQQLQQRQRCLELDEKLSAILQGKAQPADAAEQLALAQLCQQYKQHYAAAARFYAEAFAAQPRLAQDPRVQHRYHAAGAAALAANGRGQDADKLDDNERARLRRQALDWLSADLTAWTIVADKGPPQARPLVERTLQHWQTDADLASLRDKELLTKLPDAERKAWQQLWAGVAALLKRAQEKKSSLPE
jgi:Flp pilus assembly protein TadD